MNLTHKNCNDDRCALCFKEHTDLGYELEMRTGINTVDHLGKYHKWLSDHGIEPETEWGWATDASFDEDNINAYVAYWVGDIA